MKKVHQREGRAIIKSLQKLTLQHREEDALRLCEAITSLAQSTLAKHDPSAPIPAVERKVEETSTPDRKEKGGKNRSG